jgi:hypothetical protein
MVRNVLDVRCLLKLLMLCQAKQLEHDYDSARKGGNRFATILLYMSDLGPEDGGETVFPKGWPPNLPEAGRTPAKAVSNL